MLMLCSMSVLKVDVLSEELGWCSVYEIDIKCGSDLVSEHGGQNKR